MKTSKPPSQLALSQPEQEFNSLRTMQLNVESSRMIVEETPDSQKASSKNLLSQYLKKREGTEASIRQLSSEAKLKLILDPAFARLNSHEKIVSMDHESERYVPAIDTANYKKRNYLAR